MGNNGCPQRLQVAPSSPRRLTRFTSAMPSSMCWPVGFSCQCMTVSASSLNQLVRSSADHTPTLFTQPARLVLELTSGLTVTSLRATAGAARLTSSKVRPKAACVVAVPDGVLPKSTGTAGGAVAGSATRRRASAVVLTSCPSVLSASKRPWGASGSSPMASASWRYWSTVSSEEWFCGCPSVGRPLPLMV